MKINHYPPIRVGTRLIDEDTDVVEVTEIQEAYNEIFIVVLKLFKQRSDIQDVAPEWRVKLDRAYTWERYHEDI